MNANNKNLSGIPKSDQHQLSFLDRETEIDCPRCENRLGIAMLDQVKIAGCQSCAGFLIQNEIFATLVREQRAEYSGDDVPAKPPNQNDLNKHCYCPACGEQMETHFYMGPGRVVIDSCIHCGLLWLDGDELKRIVQAPGARGESKTSDIQLDVSARLAGQGGSYSHTGDVAGLAIALTYLFD